MLCLFEAAESSPPHRFGIASRSREPREAKACSSTFEGSPSPGALLNHIDKAHRRRLLDCPRDAAAADPELFEVVEGDGKRPVLCPSVRHVLDGNAINN